MLCIDPWFFYYCALLLMLVPLPWLLAAAMAAIVHELCHIAVILLFGETIHSISLRPRGIIIDASFSKPETELFSALAGPVGSLGLILLCHSCPQIALCGFLQGIFNLLPIYPLDGGRVVRCALMLWIPAMAEKIFTALEVSSILLLFLGFLSISSNPIPGILAILLAFRLIQRKIPCKGRRNGLQ